MPDEISIKIENFIFHVVHHGEPNPELLEETPIGKYESFFAARIREVMDGNSFYFDDESVFMANLKKIKANNAEFVTVSKLMATNFHTDSDRRIKAGVMILIKCKIDNLSHYVLFKYDHESVVYYEKTKDRKAVLKELSDTFTKNKDALQKSAIVRLDGDNTTVTVVDKSDRADITDFFKVFLGIKRQFSSEELTIRVKKAYQDVVRQHKDDFPTDYTGQTAKKFFDMVKHQPKFEAEKFAEGIFGAHHTPQILKTFERALKQNKVAGESFSFYKNLKEPPQRKIKTDEGVSITIPKDAENTIKQTDNAKETIITITTKKVFPG